MGDDRDRLGLSYCNCAAALRLGWYERNLSSILKNKEASNLLINHNHDHVSKLMRTST
jgi:hypothetical protein